MITVLGASGYIGSNIFNRLVRDGKEVYAPKRHQELQGRDLGNVLYCIGMTSDFRTKPFETVEAHVCKLNDILKNCSFESLTYLSSTRVYINASRFEAKEEDQIIVNPSNTDDLYTLTKLTGESLCHASGRRVKIARLSNIYGNDLDSENFLTDLVRKIKNNGAFSLHSTLTSAKDYLFIDDAVNLLIDIAERGKEKVYNVASGKNTSNEEIIEALTKEAAFTYNISENAKEIIFPRIMVNRIVSEFKFNPQNITKHIAILLKEVRHV